MVDRAGSREKYMAFRLIHVILGDADLGDANPLIMMEVIILRRLEQFNIRGIWAWLWTLEDACSTSS